MKSCNFDNDKMSLWNKSSPNAMWRGSRVPRYYVKGGKPRHKKMTFFMEI